jgi:hypothetical protein
MHNLPDAKINKMLQDEYSIVLNGAMIGYLLALLSAEQQRLSVVMEEDITDAKAALSSAVNDMVGTTIMHELYRVAGAEFLAFVLNVDPEAMERVMKAESKEELDAAAKKFSVNKKRLN